MLALLFLHEGTHFIKSEMIPKILISREVNSRDKHKRQCQIMNLCQQEKELHLNRKNKLSSSLQMTPFPFSLSTGLLRMENSICFRCYSLEEIQD